MDSITAIETAIIARLQEDIAATEYRVERFPDRPAEYRLNHSKGAVLVAYSGSQYTNDESSLNIRSMSWVITVLVKGIQTHHAAYPLIERVINQLDGWKPEDKRKMFIINDKFISENSGIWQYDLLFNLNKNHIAGHHCLPNTST